MTSTAAPSLTPYVPRLVIEWLRDDPARAHREVDGSMVFVDISGFTALSERLARKGKVGAELMRDSLNGVFTALLDEAYDYGAGLLKWGGDALLLLFDGPEHEARACRAAWEMQRTLDAVGRLRTGSGPPIVLRMSVGIATGTFAFFMTGTVHRELLVAGPDATRTVSIEAIADAGEICVSEALARRLDPACIGGVKEEIAHLLVAPPDVERRRAPDVGDVSALDIASCIPVAAREHVLLARSEPEHRTITAAFIDLMDTDLILEREGLDRLAEGLDERISSIQEAALEYGVPFYESDVGKGSVKALLTAGAPSSTGQDEERMLRALRQIMDRPGLVPMRVGVNTGKVFTGDFGPSYRRSYRVFGDAINTAARVMSKAEPGQLLSTEIVLDRSRTLFETMPIAPFAAKGKAEPVRASVVGTIRGVRAAHRAEAELRGRDRELEALLSVVDDARQGNGWVVEVSAAGGLGKSRLVEEVAACAPDVLVIHARCEPYEAATPYYALREPMRTVLEVSPDADSPEVERALRAAVATGDPGLEPWVPLLGLLLGLDLAATPETEALDEAFLRDRLTEVALRFLARRLASAPTMLVVEDAQFMDEASRDLLLRLARAGREMHQVLLVTHSRPGVAWAPEDEEARVAAITLLPLPERAMTTIAEELTDAAPLQPHEIDQIVARAGGNPLFLQELIETVRRTGSVESLPDSVEALVAGEIDRLGASDRTVLRYAAVLGTTFEPGLLEQAVSQEIVLDAGIWDRLADVLDREPSGALRFRNTLLRDAAYEGLPYRRRRVLHERVGLAIEAAAGVSVEEETGALALHFHEAQRWDRAWGYCCRAGDRAMEIYANVEAGRFLRRALVAGRRLRGVGRAELASVYERLGDVHWRLGEYPSADAAYRAARRLYGPTAPESGRVLVKECRIPAKLGQFPKALRRTGRAIGALAAVEGTEAARHRADVFVINAAVRYWQNRTRESIDWCRRAVDEATLAGALEPLATAYQTLDLALRDSDRLDEAVHSEQALSLWEQVGDLRQQALTLNNLGVIAKDLARWNESRAYYDRALALFERTGDRWAASLARYNIAELLVDQGHHEEAEAMLRDVLRVWRAQATSADVAEAERELGKLLLRRGDAERARALLESARAEQLSQGQAGDVLLTDVHLVELALLEDDPDAALALAADAIERTTSAGRGTLRSTFTRLTAVAHARAGRVAEALETAAAALALARERADAYEVLLALDASLEAGAGTEALHEEAARIREQLGVVLAPALRR